MYHQINRCRHCQSTYSYQMSGDGCQDKNNDRNHCPDCMKVINKALSKIPKRFEKVLIPTKDFTFDELVDIETKNFDALKTAGKIPFKRVALPMFRDPLGSAEANESHIVHVKGKEYYCTRWPNPPHEEQVFIAMEKCLATGQIAPWNLCD